MMNICFKNEGLHIIAPSYICYGQFSIKNSYLTYINYRQIQMQQHKSRQETTGKENAYPEKEITQLQPFDNGYTVTSLIRHTEESLIHLIQAKKLSKWTNNAQNSQEVEALQKIKENVSILKTILTQNIHEIFMNMYQKGNHSKKQQSTVHTLKNKSINPHQGGDQVSREIMVSDFKLESDRKNCQEINNLQVNKKNLSHYHHKYAKSELNMEITDSILIGQDEQDFRVTPFFVNGGQKGPSIKIEDDQQDYDDLICYQSDIEHVHKRKIFPKKDKNKEFSPISEKPAEEDQCSTQKQCKNEINKRFPLLQRRLTDNITSKDHKQLIFTKIKQKSLPKKIHYKKFNYLHQAEHI